MTKPAAPLFIFKVFIKGQPKVWRRIAIKGNQTLDDLHNAIFDAFDRYDEHLYSFYFPIPGKTGRERLVGAVEYSDPVVVDDDLGFSSDAQDSTQARIEELNLVPHQEFEYLFDYGDQWWHKLTVESLDGTPEPKKKYPAIIESAGKSPPQYPDLDDDEIEEDD